MAIKDIDIGSQILGVIMCIIGIGVAIFTGLLFNNDIKVWIDKSKQTPEELEINKQIIAIYSMIGICSLGIGILIFTGTIDSQYVTVAFGGILLLMIGLNLGWLSDYKVQETQKQLLIISLASWLFLLFILFFSIQRNDNSKYEYPSIKKDESVNILTRINAVTNAYNNLFTGSEKIFKKRKHVV
jgi:hypothetical protein